MTERAVVHRLLVTFVNDLLTRQKIESSFGRTWLDRLGYLKEGEKSSLVLTISSFGLQSWTDELYTTLGITPVNHDKKEPHGRVDTKLTWYFTVVDNDGHVLAGEGTRYEEVWSSDDRCYGQEIILVPPR